MTKSVIVAKVPDTYNWEQKKEIEDVIAAVEEAAKGNDAEKITEELNKVYPAMKALLDAKLAQEQATAGAETAPQEDVVDATFTEKKDDTK